MIDIKGQLTITSDGVIWFNDEKGKCCLRIQKVTPKQIHDLEWVDHMIDIKLSDLT